MNRYSIEKVIINIHFNNLYSLFLTLFIVRYFRMISLITQMRLVKQTILALAIFTTAVELLQTLFNRYEPNVLKELDIIYGGLKIPAEQSHEKITLFSFRLIIFSVMINLFLINLIYQEVWEGVLRFQYWIWSYSYAKCSAPTIKVI